MEVVSSTETSVLSTTLHSITTTFLNPNWIFIAARTWSATWMSILHSFLLDCSLNGNRPSPMRSTFCAQVYTTDLKWRNEFTVGGMFVCTYFWMWFVYLCASGFLIDEVCFVILICIHSLWCEINNVFILPFVRIFNVLPKILPCFVEHGALKY